MARTSQGARSEASASPGLSNLEVAEVYARYGHLVRRRCRMILRDSALADDAFQNAFIKVMRLGAGMRQADSPLRWLYRVADRCCFDLLKRQKRRTEVTLDDSDLEEGVTIDSPARQAERAAVMSVLRKLSDGERQIAVLAWVEELSQGEIAEVTGWSRQTINKKLQRIRTRAERLLGGTR